MISRNTTQAAVAVLGMIGLVSATIVTLFVPDLTQERSMLVGGLIAATSTSAAWLFRLNGNK
ncbi:hypothetical protein LCGC14_0887670 [marine sediment metagenome]|uniref:Uncharacterized protein n=1 Tax=marine sediment metagenome TaxID=412755 RepID=A0A0F9S738_9ZZZZ